LAASVPTTLAADITAMAAQISTTRPTGTRRTLPSCSPRARGRVRSEKIASTTPAIVTA